MIRHDVNTVSFLKRNHGIDRDCLIRNLFVAEEIAVAVGISVFEGKSGGTDRGKVVLEGSRVLLVTAPALACKRQDADARKQ